MIDIKVGANSSITDCLVANPIKDFDKKEIFMMQITQALRISSGVHLILYNI